MNILHLTPIDAPAPLQTQGAELICLDSAEHFTFDCGILRYGPPPRSKSIGTLTMRRFASILALVLNIALSWCVSGALSAAESAVDKDSSESGVSVDKSNAPPAKEPSTEKADGDKESPAPKAAPAASDAAKGGSKSSDSKGVVADFLKTDPRASGDAKGSSPEPRLSFNFRFAPWELVLRRFAEEAKLTLDINEVPPGTFNYYDSGTYTPAEALDVINGYLLQKGYVLVRRDKFLVVVNVDQIPPNLIPQVSLSDLPKRGRNELISAVLPLAEMDAKSAAEEIKDLLGPQGKVVPLLKTNRILVTDIGSNVQRIHEFLTEMGAVQDTKGTTFRSFKLVNISATEAERTLRDLFGLAPRSNSMRQAAAPAASAGGRDRQNDQRGGGFPWQGGAFPWQGGGGGGGMPWQGGNFGGRGGRGSGGDRDDGGEQRDGQGQAGGQSNAAQSSNRLLLAIDARTNSLLVTCTVEDMRLVEQAIKTIDVIDSGAERDS